MNLDKTPEALLALARTLVIPSAHASSGLWPRAASLLARQALEAGLDRIWAAREPGLSRVSGRAQITCLSGYLRDDELAGDVAYAWSALSQACHCSGYEIGPTAEELQRRFTVVERLITRAAALAADSPKRSTAESDPTSQPADADT